MSQMQYGITSNRNDWETEDQAKFRHAKAKAKVNRIRTMRLRQTLMLKAEAKSRESYAMKPFTIKATRKGEVIATRIVTGAILHLIHS